MRDEKRRADERSAPIEHETAAEAQPGEIRECSGECISRGPVGTTETDRKPRMLRVATDCIISAEPTPKPAVDPELLKPYERVLGTKRGRIFEELYPLRIEEEQQITGSPAVATETDGKPGKQRIASDSRISAKPIRQPSIDSVLFKNHECVLATERLYALEKILSMIIQKEKQRP